MNMEILETKALFVAASAGRAYLSLHERRYKRGDNEGRYFMVCRGDTVVPVEAKRPDAVVIVAFVEEQGQPTKLVLSSEYRIPLGCREISFPAGLIDASDYNESIPTLEAACRDAACKAAIREMREETGLDFVPTEVSPVNLYSSAGMTNESICYVFGYASGTPSTELNEVTEDIRVMLVTLPEIVQMLDGASERAFSKTCWPFLWSFKYNGFPGEKQRCQTS